ncbi:MAG: chemotaxis protein CheW [Pseudomonadota bacterium]
MIRPPSLHSPKDALGYYLEDLLGESRPLDSPRPTAPRPSQILRPVMRQPALAPVEVRSVPARELLVQPLLRALETRPAPVVLTTIPQIQIQTQVETQPQIQPQGPPPAPDWASGQFPVLFFDIAGRRFALPLVLLHSVGKRVAHTVRLPGQASWNLGIFVHRGDKVTLVDTAALLMPGLLHPGSPPDLSNRYLLRLGGGRWALACDALGQVQKLTLDDIRWHRNPGRDRFIAGVITKQLSMILDIAAILRAVEGN